MLQHMGDVFFTVEEIDRKDNHMCPTIYLNIYNRKTRQIIGAMRFNHDPSYAKEAKRIRMSFDVFDPKDLDPLRGNLLEDIIVGGFIWINPVMAGINAKSIEILQNLQCKKGESDPNMYIFSKELTTPFLSKKLAQEG